MCNYMGINIKTAAAESPWRNGTVKRFNQTLKTMMNKIISDAQSSLEIVLSWTLKAKNNLQNVASFSHSSNSLLKMIKKLKSPDITFD